MKTLNKSLPDSQAGTQNAAPFDVIAFDADDTLWHNETLFQLTHEKFESLLSEYQEPEWTRKKLYETEMRNLNYFGYGIKGFTLSMIETAIELTESRITGKEIQQIIDFARHMVKAPVELLPNAAETVVELSSKYTLMIITKGDIFDQESKIARSGLIHYFNYIEILSAKTTETYQKLLQKHGIPPERFLMIGNSLKSDVFPLLEIGAHAVFIPYPILWEHEVVTDEEKKRYHYPQLDHIGLVPDFISSFPSSK